MDLGDDGGGTPWRLQDAATLANLVFDQDGGYTQLLHDIINMGSQEDCSFQENFSYMELLTGKKDENKVICDIAAAEIHGKEVEVSCDGNEKHLGSNTGPWDDTLPHNIHTDEMLDAGEQRAGAPEHDAHVKNVACNTNCDAPSSDPGSRPTAAASNASAEHTDKEFLDEEDIENFLENEKVAAEEGNTYNMESTLKPYLRQQFASKEEAQDFFNFYASVAGFSSVIVASYRTISKKRNNEVTRFHMKCHRHGKTEAVERENLVPQRQTTVIARTGCKVEMIASEKGPRWEITRINLEHNHELEPSSRFFRSHKYMSDPEKDMIRTLKRTNNPTRKIVSILAYMRGGIAMLN